MIYQFLIILFTILFVIIFIIIFAKFINSNDIKEYEVLTPIKGNGINMNYCLNGCIRGTCKKSNLQNSCKYDFQCNYCQDRKTNMFYVDFNNEKEIVPLYEEESKLTKNQKDLLNDSIDKNNKYINELNKRIKIMNS